MKTEKDIAAYNVIREQHRLLGHMSFGELSVLGLFILLVVMWFTRDPGFVSGWATDVFNSKAEFVHKISTAFCHISFDETFIELSPFISALLRYVTDATVAIFIAVLLFVLPSKPPRFCSWRTQSFDTGEFWKNIHSAIF